MVGLNVVTAAVTGAVGEWGPFGTHRLGHLSAGAAARASALCADQLQATTYTHVMLQTNPTKHVNEHGMTA